MKPSHKIAAVLSGMVLLVALAVGVSLWTFRQIEETGAVRAHTSGVIDRTEGFLSSLKDAETSARGYLLTADETFLEQYLAVRDHAGTSLKDLRQRTLLGAAQKHLDTLGPLTAARMAELAQVVELRRNHDLTAALAIERSSTSKELMKSIRAESNSVLRLEQDVLTLREAEFQSSMRHLFAIIVVASLLALLLALAFAYLLYREMQQRLEHRVHLETMHLFGIQEETNKQLLQANVSLQAHQEELAGKNQELESARFVAEKANLAKSDFLASMSHELRTPLNSVLGFAQLMEYAKDPPSAAQKQSIDQILKAGRHLLELINEILDLAKIESGRTKLSQETVSLSEVLEDCRAMIHPLAEQCRIQVTFPSPDTPIYVVGDPVAVKQVMINMLSNAIKYNRVSGTVFVRYEMRGENRLRVSVTDTGTGLAPEHLVQLFQPFNRLGRETGPEEGTGIGLVVTKQLVELMGGAVGVESRLHVGSVFWFELALAAAPELAADSVGETSPNAGEPGPETSAFPARTVLYVEDNPANLALVAQLISRRSNLKLLTAINGHLGIQLARTYQPDLILMDIQLPGMSGLEALKILREDQTTASIPVLALSARANPRDVEKGIAAGFCRYLTKPINIIEFMDALDAGLRCDEQKLPLSASPGQAFSLQ